jgi:hypothetical protein
MKNAEETNARTPSQKITTWAVRMEFFLSAVTGAKVHHTA